MGLSCAPSVKNISVRNPRWRTYGRCVLEMHSAWLSQTSQRSVIYAVALGHISRFSSWRPSAMLQFSKLRVLKGPVRPAGPIRVTVPNSVDYLHFNPLWERVKIPAACHQSGELYSKFQSTSRRIEKSHFRLNFVNLLQCFDTVG